MHMSLGLCQIEHFFKRLSSFINLNITQSLKITDYMLWFVVNLDSNKDIEVKWFEKQKMVIYKINEGEKNCL